MEIKKVAVLGAGLMGSGIAAQCANAGIPVRLLDIVPKDATNRNQFSEGAVAKMLKTKPAPFMSDKASRLIECGNLEDDLDKIKDCDWILEAIIEDINIKRDLYARLEVAKAPDAIITSNTSTIPLKELVQGRSEAFKKTFGITHFFNPPRYMRLLELVQGDMSDAQFKALWDFGDIKLGKEVIRCKDTPGFIANRIGIFWMTLATKIAVDLGLKIEEADAVCGKPMGIPSTGVFGLADLTGVDLMPKVSGSMLSLLPKSDPLHQHYEAEHKLNKVVQQLIAEGYTGRKGKGGFYRMDKAKGKKSKEAWDFDAMAFRPSEKPSMKSIDAGRKGLKAMVQVDDKGGQYAWEIVKYIAGYSAMLVGEIADDIHSIDLSMINGYAFKYGPFQWVDQLGVDYFVERMQKDGWEVAPIFKAAAGRPLYREDETGRYQMGLDGQYHLIAVDEGAWTLADKKRGKKPIFSNRGASIWDVGDGVACVEFHTKMNAIDMDIADALREAPKLGAKGYKAVIIGHDADNFSVGANIGMALFQVNMAMYPMVESMIAEGQKVMYNLKYSPIPIVAAPAGMALGGGCEVCLHATAINAAAETYMGLVEVGVGVLPGWGGCKESILRNMAASKVGGAMGPLTEAFTNISTAKVATSAEEARGMNYLKKSDHISMNRRRVLADAKALALKLAENYKVPEEKKVRLPGATARIAFNMAVEGFAQTGKATPHDVVVSDKIAFVLSGGDTDMTDEVDEKYLMKLERDAFMQLLHTRATLDRIEHMLTTGKPLRN